MEQLLALGGRALPSSVASLYSLPLPTRLALTLTLLPSSLPWDPRLARCCRLQVELHQEDNAYLSYWLSNTVTLLYLMQKNIKPASGGGYAARLKAQGQQVRRGAGGWGAGQEGFPI